MKKILVMVFSLAVLMYSEKTWASEIRIIDADTIELNGLKVRLNGIDAPEMAQKCQDMNTKMYLCGISSRDALKSLIQKMPDRMVQCEYMGEDAYGRLIRECALGKININMWLVENGWALAYRKYSKKYVLNENSAKINRIGIWNGKFVEPWNWRRGKRLYSEIN